MTINIQHKPVSKPQRQISIRQFEVVAWRQTRLYTDEYTDLH